MSQEDEKKDDKKEFDPTKETASVASAGSASTDIAGVAKAAPKLNGAVSSTIATIKANAAPISLGAAIAESEIALKEMEAHPVKPVVPETPTVISRAGGGAGAAIAALGIYNGTKEFLEARKEGNTVKAAVSATDAGMGFVNLGIQGAGAMGKEVAPLLEGGAKIGGTVVLVAQAGLNIYEAKGDFLDRDAKGNVTGIGNKGEVTIKEGLKVGTGLGIAALATGAVATAGVVGIAAVAAPVIVAGAAVYAVDKVATAAIDANNAWKDLDKQIEENGAARRVGRPGGGIQISDDPNRPDARRYAHIISETIRSSADIRDDHIVGGQLERKDGRILPTPANAKILSDPRNLPEISQALDKKIDTATKVMKDNDQSLPVILRWTDASMAKTDKYETAKMNLANATGAKEEVGMYKQDLASYDAAHPPQPAAAAAPQKPVPPTASPADIKAVQTELASRGLYDGAVNGKWNKETNQGLNQLIAGAQTEGQQAGLYKGNLDNKYGNGTAQVFATSIAAKSPQAVDPAFVKAMNNMYTTGALQTVYKADPPQRVVAPDQAITVAAKATEVPLEHTPITASLTQPAATAPVTPVVADAGTRTTGSAARDISGGDPDFDVASIKPAFTVAAIGVTPEAPAPAPAGPVVAQRNNMGAPQNA